MTPDELLHERYSRLKGPYPSTAVPSVRNLGSLESDFPRFFSTLPYLGALTRLRLNKVPGPHPQLIADMIAEADLRQAVPLS